MSRAAGKAKCWGFAETVTRYAVTQGQQAMRTQLTNVARE
jgi:hypothetical protein